MGHPARSRRTRAAFSLIELLAVIAILGLISTFIAPNLSVLRERRLNHAAMQLASLLELARQRTVVTGVPHRIWFDLEAAAYRLEWLGDDRELEEAAIALPDEYDVRGATPLPLAAPARSDFEFQPIPGNFGRFVYLDDDVFIAGFETAEGWIEAGESWIGFDRDGTSAYTEIVIEDGSGRNVTLAVLPLEDAVRFVDEEV